MIAVTIYITRKAAKILHKEGTKAMATACRQRAQSLHIAVILGLRLHASVIAEHAACTPYYVCEAEKSVG